MANSPRDAIRTQASSGLIVWIPALAGWLLLYWGATNMDSPAAQLTMPMTPFCLSSGDSSGVDFSATPRDERVDLSGEVTLQGSNGVEFGVPFCNPTSNIILRSLVGP